MKNKLRSIRRQNKVALYTLLDFKSTILKCNCGIEANIMLLTNINKHEFLQFPFNGNQNFLCQSCLLKWKKSHHNAQEIPIPNDKNVPCRLSILHFPPYNMPYVHK